MKLWGGRFSHAKRDELFEQFSESFSVDQRLIRYDLAVNAAYVRELGRARVLTAGEVKKLMRGLKVREARQHRARLLARLRDQSIHQSQCRALDFGNRVFDEQPRFGRDQIVTAASGAKFARQRPDGLFKPRFNPGMNVLRRGAARPSRV